MALEDILERIAADADAEVTSLVGEAEAEAERIHAGARAEAEGRRGAILERARREAEGRRRTIVANARLRARDAVLRERRVLIERALADAVAALATLPDGEYVRLVARRVASAARGGERVLVAESDRERLSSLADAVAEEAPSLDLVYVADPAPLERGVLLVADRATVEVSPSEALAARRGEIEQAVAEALFGERGED